MLDDGDPTRLPALVVSQRSADFGLGKSLLDRLMFRCDKEHMMLDVQYRISPAISAFPSSIFTMTNYKMGKMLAVQHRGEMSIIHPKPYTFIHVDGRESRA
jgi:superfamily I DNA and/or RNA helicase